MHVLAEAAVCMLAAYGLITLALSAAGYLSAKGPAKHTGVRLVLIVKDAEEQIEYIVRNAARHDLTSRVLSDGKLAVIDMDSSDNTYLLLEKLQKDFPNIEPIKYENRFRIFENPFA